LKLIFSGELGKILGAKWKAMDEKEKEVNNKYKQQI
jgi:hypothetical protein